MKYKYISGTICAVLLQFLASCDSEAPITIQTSDWVITYHQQYSKIYNDGESFHNWFLENTDHFDRAQFRNKRTRSFGESNWIRYDIREGDYIEWEDYSKWEQGYIIWLDTIYNVTEEDVREKALLFKSFSMEGEKTNEFDHRETNYMRL